jgi:GMP synthase (glutamine-hydrolysing)
MNKPFLVLQSRPEDEPADNELEAFMTFGGLGKDDIHRVRMEQGAMPRINLNDYSAVLVGGGPYNVSDPEDFKPPEQRRFEKELGELLEEVYDRDFPYFGNCYGLGFLAKFLGVDVSKDRYYEPVGALTINLTDAAKNDPLTSGMDKSFRAFAGHKEAVQFLPQDAVLLGSSPTCPVHFMRVKQNLYGSQFHPELDKDGIALRIRFYKNKGYFPPADAESLIDAAYREDVTEPIKILRRFVDRYSTPV